MKLYLNHLEAGFPITTFFRSYINSGEKVGSIHIRFLTEGMNAELVKAMTELHSTLITHVCLKSDEDELLNEFECTALINQFTENYDDDYNHQKDSVYSIELKLTDA